MYKSNFKKGVRRGCGIAFVVIGMTIATINAATAQYVPDATEFQEALGFSYPRLGAGDFQRPAIFATRIPASSNMLEKHGVAFFQVPQSSRTGSVITALDSSGQHVAQFSVSVDPHGIISLSAVSSDDAWDAKFGTPTMHESDAGMFLTTMFDISSERNGERNEFVFLSDIDQDEQLGVTYLLNGSRVRTDIADITPELEAKFKTQMIDSKADQVFDVPLGEMTLSMLYEPRLSNFLPVGLGFSGTLAKHDAESTAAACAIAAACTIFAWGGGLGCATCVVASATCAWGIHDLYTDLK